MHDKVVQSNHLHTFLAHVYTSVLQATARPHMGKRRCLSPHKILYGICPPLPLLPFIPTGLPSSAPTTQDGTPCPPPLLLKLLDAETATTVVFSRDVTCHHPEAHLILPAIAVGSPSTAPRRISAYRCQRLCPSSPRLLPLLRRDPHQLQHHRL